MKLLLPFLLGTVLYLAAPVTSAIDTPSLDDIAARISSFLEITGNGTLNSRISSSSEVGGCSLACSFLNYAVPGQISYPESRSYQFEESRYWSVQQATTLPSCRFSPQSALGVSLGVLTARVTQCQFAVKSGGHAAFSGASNIEDGMTIDLIHFTQVDISADQTVTSVGAGNIWYSVYSKLEQSNLTVIGGRVAGIGVGGLTLGGGISYFSNRYGWACDNINGYEVVFADGTVHEVTQSSHPDLYFALRGGGNNFGIVTRFDMATYPQGDLWAGSVAYLYNETTAEALDSAFYNFNINSPSDTYAQVMYIYGYIQSIGLWVIQPDLQYGRPEPFPAILKNFTNVPNTMPVSESFKITNHSALTVDFNTSTPAGFRQSYWTVMIKNKPTLIKDMVAIYMSEINPIKNITGLIPTIIFQPIPISMSSHFTKNGGNALGISASDGPLNLMNIATTWTNLADDETVLATMGRIIAKINATAYEQGAGYPYLYMNYAAEQQDVILSYGAENVKRLKDISKKYDPESVWQKLQPGYFKLGF